VNKGSAKTAFLVIFGFIVLFLILAFFQFRALRKKVTLISCDALKEEISESLSKYRVDNPDEQFPPGTVLELKKLFDKGYLKHFQHCPQGGTYIINRYGEVYCTYHNPNLGE